VSWLASGAAATIGLVWLTRLFRRKTAEREEWDSPPLEVRPGTQELPKAALTFPDDVDDEAMAAADARRDIGEKPLDLDAVSDPENVDLSENAETVHAHEAAEAQDEHYDALDADDLGTEWLFRATASSAPDRPRTPEELLERTAEEAARRKP
jgi:hypothetical protein